MKYQATLTIDIETGSDTSTVDHFTAATNLISSLRFRVLNPQSGHDRFGPSGTMITRVDVGSVVLVGPGTPVVDPSRSTPNT